MLNEQLIEVRRLQHKTDWPIYYIVTDAGYYEFTWQSFTGTLPHKQSTPIQAPLGFQGHRISEVRGDGESAVIRLDNENLIVFDLIHDPYGRQIESHPEIRFMHAREAQEWRNEYDEMEILAVVPLTPPAGE